MPAASVLRGRVVELRPFTHADISPAYLGWLRDPDVVRFTDIDPAAQTTEAVHAYVDTALRDPSVRLWAIHEIGHGHVGNLRLSDINLRHGRATLALIIGDKTRWGRGLASDAIIAVSRHGLYSMGLRKICAGVLAGNPASRRAFEKAGFHLEAVLGRHAVFEGRPIDVLQMACFADETSHAQGPSVPERP